jgi:hypothetical protein
MPRYKVEALRHLNQVYLVQADDYREAGDIVQKMLEGRSPLGDRRILETLRSEVADAEVIGVYNAEEEPQPSGPPC